MQCNLVKFEIELYFKEVKANQFVLSSYKGFYDPNRMTGYYAPGDNFSAVDEMMMGN